MLTRQLLIFALSSLVLLAACQTEQGELEFRVNGEDFVREGFVSKDGWQIQFEHVYISLSDVQAYQTDPPFDSATGAQPEGNAVSAGTAQVVDLAAGDSEAEPILLSKVPADVGQYNAISWVMAPADTGHTIQLIGTATRDGQTIPFDIKVDRGYAYVCGEYVGDERKGFVDPGVTDDVEMTFHFDHIFGDAGVSAAEPLNTGALGFDPLAALAEGGALDVSLAGLEAGLSAAEYATLLDTLGTLGHVGEGHCFEADNGYTAHEP